MNYSAVTLLSILSNTQSSIQIVREGAEASLKELFSNEESMYSLIIFATAVEHPVYLRQLTLVLVGQQISRSWMNISQKTRKNIIDSSLTCFQSIEACIRNSSMVILAKIMSNAKTMRFIISKIGEYSINDEDSEEDMIFVQDLISSWTSTSVQWISEFLKFLNNQSTNLSQNDYSYINSKTNSTTSTSTSTTHLNIIEDIMESYMGVLLELFRALTTIVEIFPDNCHSHFPSLLNVSWTLLCNLRPYYLQSMRRSPQDMDATDSSSNGYNGYASDGDRLDCETLLGQVLDLLSVAWTFRDEQARSLLQGDIQPLLRLLTEFMQLPISSQIQWSSEPNEFLAAEQEETFEYNLRCSGSELIHETCKASASSKQAFTGVVTLFQHEINIFLQNGINSIEDELWIEALMWVFGAMGKVYINLIQRHKHHCSSLSKRKSTANDVLVDIPPGAVLELVFNPSRALVCGRAAWLFAIFSDLADVNTQNKIAKLCVSHMGSEWPLVVRLQCCRALGDISLRTYGGNEESTKDKNIADDTTSEIIRMATILCADTSDCTVHIPIETIITALKRCNQNLCIEDIHMIIHLSLNIWMKYPSDPLCTELTKEIKHTIKNVSLSSSTSTSTSNSISSVSNDILFISLYEAVKVGLDSTATDDCCYVSSTSLLVHLFIGFSDHFNDESAVSLLSDVVNLIRQSLPSPLSESLSSSTSRHMRSCLVMCLVHLFARDPDSSCRMLGLVDVQLQQQSQSRSQEENMTMNASSNGNGTSSSSSSSSSSRGVFVLLESTLSLLLREWKELHGHFGGNSGLYNESVSTIGLLQLARMLAKHQGTSNELIAAQLLESALQTFPRILCESEDVTSDISENSRDAHIDDNDDIEENDNEDDFSEFDEDETPDDDDGDDDGDSTGARGLDGRCIRRGGKNPFAPAEQYMLSDMLNDVSGDGNGSDGNSGNVVVVSVPEDLIFSPKRLDPLILGPGSLQHAISTLLKCMMTTTGNSGCRSSCSSIDDDDDDDGGSGSGSLVGGNTTTSD
eukprot:gene593-1146_t